MKTRKLLIIPLLAFCASALAIDSDLFNKMQKLNRGQQATENLHAQAMSAIDECELDEAEQLLQRMRQQNYSTANISSVKNKLEDTKDQQRHARQIRSDAIELADSEKFSAAYDTIQKINPLACSSGLAESARKYIKDEENKRYAQARQRQRQSSSSSSSSGSCANFVNFHFQGPDSGFFDTFGYDQSASITSPNNYTLSGSTLLFSDRVVVTFRRSQGCDIAGTYNYTYSARNANNQRNSWRGSFYFDGRSETCTIYISGGGLQCY